MRIALLSQNDPALEALDRDGGAIAARAWATGLVADGCAVTYFTPRILESGVPSAYLEAKRRAQAEPSDGDLVVGPRVERVHVRAVGASIDRQTGLSFLSRIMNALAFGEAVPLAALDAHEAVLFLHPTSAFGFIGRWPAVPTLTVPLLLGHEYRRFRPVAGVYLGLEREVLRRSSLVVAVSRDEERALAEYQVPPERIAVVRPGIATDRFPHVLRERPRSPVTIVTVGTIRAQKNQHALLDVCDCLRAVGLAHRFLVVGGAVAARGSEGARYAEDFLRAISDRGLAAHFELAGGVPQAAVASLLARADLAVLPSRVESFGQAALECIVSGLPTILCDDVPAYREFAVPGQNCLCVPPAPAALASAVERLVRDGELYRTLSGAGEEMRVGCDWRASTATLGSVLARAVRGFKGGTAAPPPSASHG